MESPRILVIGAGVNGSAIAAGLFSGGVDVTVLARGQRYEDIREDGIVIINPFNNKQSITRVPVINALEPEDCYDYILVVIRKNQVTDLLPILALNRSPNIIFMGNNLTGPDEFIQSLGKERVMMGAVYAAGKREGNVIRAIVFKSVASPIGEIDGLTTPRLKQLARTLRQAGFGVELSRNIVDTQMTHAVGVALIGKLVLKHHNDLHALARSQEDLSLFIDARREGHRLMRILGHQVIPASEAWMDIIPNFAQAAGFKILLNTKFGEVGLAYHVSQAPDEMIQLAEELQTLVDQADLPVPAIRKILDQD